MGEAHRNSNVFDIAGDGRGRLSSHTGPPTLDTGTGTFSSSQRMAVVVHQRTQVPPAHRDGSILRAAAVGIDGHQLWWYDTKTPQSFVHSSNATRQITKRRQRFKRSIVRRIGPSRHLFVPPAQHGRIVQHPTRVSTPGDQGTEQKLFGLLHGVPQTGGGQRVFRHVDGLEIFVVGHGQTVFTKTLGGTAVNRFQHTRVVIPTGDLRDLDVGQCRGNHRGRSLTPTRQPAVRCDATPVIFPHAHLHQGCTQRAWTVGMEGYVTKTVHPVALRRGHGSGVGGGNVTVCSSNGTRRVPADGHVHVRDPHGGVRRTGTVATITVSFETERVGEGAGFFGQRR